MNPIQIFIIAFALFAISRAVSQFRRGSLRFGGIAFWLVFWLGAGVVSLLPQTTDVLAAVVGVGRGADLIVYLSIIALFYLIFRVVTKIEHVEHEITRLVRSKALEELDADKQDV